MLDGEPDSLIRQKEAHNECQGKGHDDPWILLPEPKVISGNGKCLLYSLHSSRSLLPARMTNKMPKASVSSSRKITAPQKP